MGSKDDRKEGQNILLEQQNELWKQIIEMDDDKDAIGRNEEICSKNEEVIRAKWEMEHAMS